MSVSQLDPGQITKSVYDASAGALKVTLVSSASSDPTVIGSYQIGFASINGSGGALFQIIASIPGNCNLLVPNEQTGTTLSLYTGTGGNEIEVLKIAPGQDNEVPLVIASGTRLTIRATGASAPVAGSVTLTFCG